jgi:putative PIN family toxin of toxin-antitoxin system
VVDAVREERLEAVASWELADEIVDVLSRAELRVYGIGDEDLRDVLVLIAPLLPSVDVDVQLRDATDAPVVASAIAGAADAIVTGDRDLLDNEELRAWLGEHGIQLFTVAELLELL